jgi:outer membrane protein assembly factor BamD (BamD/ComL family)
MKVARRILGVAALAMMVGVCSFAQLTKGFRGKVLDLDGKGVAGITVTLEDLGNPTNKYEVKTDAGGNFAYTGLPYSEQGYRITANVPDLPPITTVRKSLLMTLTDLNLDPREGVGIQGNVVDKQGEPVKNAKITIVNLSDSSKVSTAKTDGKGLYVKEKLPYNKEGYKVTVEIPGEKPLVREIAISTIGLLDVSFNLGKTEEGGPAISGSNPAAEAKSYYELGDYEGALQKATEAIADKNIDEKSLQAAKFFKAASLEKMEHTEDAIAAWEDYNTAYPGDVNVLGVMAKLYEAAGNTAKAEAYKKEFAAKGGKITGESYNKGVVALNGGDAQKAEGFFLKAIQEDPTDPDAHRELSIAYAQLGKYADAIDQLKIYLKMKPNASDAEQWRQAIVALEPLANPKKK